MNAVLRVLFAVLVRPAGAILRGRDPLRLRRPTTTNWRREGR